MVVCEIIYFRGINKQECIPVGCVPSIAVAVPGGWVLPRGGVSVQKGCLPDTPSL